MHLSTDAKPAVTFFASDNPIKTNPIEINPIKDVTNAQMLVRR